MGWEVAGDRKHELGFFSSSVKKKRKDPNEERKMEIKVKDRKEA